TGYHGTVHFSSSDHAAGVRLPADYTFTAADRGRHTFTGGVTLQTVGSQTVTATDTVTSSITGRGSAAVSPAAASRLVGTGFPSPTPAGRAGRSTVRAKDANGNAAAGSPGTVHFTTPAPQAALPADYPSTAADAGRHTFRVALKTAGSQSLTVTDTARATLK